MPGEIGTQTPVLYETCMPPDATTETYQNALRIPPESEYPAGVINSLAGTVAEPGQATALNELEALIDIALYKNDDELGTLRTASYAEEKLLDLYADTSVSSEMRESMVKKLFEAHTILSEKAAPNPGLNSNKFGMPVALLHLVAQHAHKENPGPNPICGKESLEELNSRVLESVDLTAHEENHSISEPQRFNQAREVIASFSKAKCGHSKIVDVGPDANEVTTQFNVDGLLTAAAKKGLAVAPLCMDDHYMLLIAEKDKASGQYKLTVVNSNLSVDLIAQRELDASSPEPVELASHPDAIKFRQTALKYIQDYEKVIRDKLENSVGGNLSSILSIDFINDSLQGNVPNACGALTTLALWRIDAHRDDPHFEIKAFVKEEFYLWHILDEQQQRNMIMAQRAKMIGETAKQIQETRFIPY